MTPSKAVFNGSTYKARIPFGNACRESDIIEAALGLVRPFNSERLILRQNRQQAYLQSAFTRAGWDEKPGSTRAIRARNAASRLAKCTRTITTTTTTTHPSSAYDETHPTSSSRLRSATACPELQSSLHASASRLDPNHKDKISTRSRPVARILIWPNISSCEVRVPHVPDELVLPQRKVNHDLRHRVRLPDDRGIVICPFQGF